MGESHAGSGPVNKSATPEDFQELVEVVTTVVGFGSGLGKAYEDGKIDITDVRFFFTPLLSIPKALDGIGRVDDALADLSPEQRKTLVNQIKEEFDIPQKDVEKKIEDGLDLLKQIYDYVKSF